MNTHTVTLTLAIPASTSCEALQIGLKAAEGVGGLVRVEVGAVAVPRRRLIELRDVLAQCEAPRPLKRRAVDALQALRAALA